MQAILLCRALQQAATAAAAAAASSTTPSRLLPALALSALRTPSSSPTPSSFPSSSALGLLLPTRSFSGAASHAAAALSRDDSSIADPCSARITPGGRTISSASAGTGTGSPPTEGAGSQLHVTVEPLSGALEGVSVISLTRPGARNAIGRQLLRELWEAVELVRQERTTRCVIVRSVVPGVFCSGADLKERATMSQSEAAEFVSRIRRTFTELQDLPMPTVAVVEGLALGGGAELALACDLRVVGAGASLAFPETQLGIIPGAGGTQRLPRIVGASRAKELIFTGRRVGGSEAAQLQLADYVVPDEQVYEKALQLAEQIVRSAPLALRQAKSAVNRGLEVDLHTGLAMEEALYAQLLPTRDRLEGLKAFAEKRKPRYTGE
ncbi:hypothetical protein Agub_g795 [Astrephomene gubernaculifera]|uniref:Methylglutaconyl-CoA hydratase n=1 Tax=Astrephomene gubernaculifera TaxID=47775 RepID=A0AAD3DH01_9CHLO|nr:hypothetical protein Agub_g795 [Astrephomene gubernaculifera]